MKITQHIGRQWEDFFSGKQDFLYPNLNSRSEFVQMLFAKGLVTNGSRVLDCGCGEGSTALQLAVAGAQLTALDYSEKMIEQANSLLQKVRNKNHHLGMNVVRGDMIALPFRNHSYDVTFSVGAFEHWLDGNERVKVMAELRRITRPGGKVILVVPNGKHPLYKVWRFIIRSDTPREVRYSAPLLANEIRKNGFSRIDVFPLGVNPGFSKYLRFKFLKFPVVLGNSVVARLPLFLRLKLTVHFFAIAEC